jgi:hypothetical protein
VAISPAQYGPKRTAGADTATSHSGPNSNTVCVRTAASTDRLMTGSSVRRRVSVRNVVATWLRSEVRSLARCSRGSRNLRYATTDSSANGIVSRYVARVGSRLATQPPASELATSAMLSMNRTRPIRRSKSAPSPVSSTTVSYTIASTVPEYMAK